jgi:hypothetical protein
MLRRRRTAVPAELAFLAPEQWAALEPLVDEQVRAARGRRDGATVRIGMHTIALDNLARTCHQLDRHDWPVEIERFFRVLGHPDTNDELGDLIRGDRASALASIRVRLYPEEIFAEVTFEVLRRPWAGEVVEAVCLDQPESVVIANREMADALGLSDDELFELGLANVRAEGLPPDHDTLAADEGVDLEVLTGPSFFTATWARWVDELVPGIGPHGALVVVPQRHQVAVHPLCQMRGGLVAPGRMLLFAHLGVSEGVGPISPQLFWWRDGTVTHLPGGMQDDGVIGFAPVDDYLEMLDQLPED